MLDSSIPVLIDSLVSPMSDDFMLVYIYRYALQVNKM